MHGLRYSKTVFISLKVSVTFIYLCDWLDAPLQATEIYATTSPPRKRTLLANASAAVLPMEVFTTAEETERLADSKMSSHLWRANHRADRAFMRFSPWELTIIIRSTLDAAHFVMGAF